MRQAVKVEDGQMKVSGGKSVAATSLLAGYYPHPVYSGIKLGESGEVNLRSAPLSVMVEGIAVSEYPIINGPEGSPYDFGPIDDVAAGDTVIACRNSDGDYYYYLPHKGSSIKTVEIIEDWWRRYSASKSPWIGGIEEKTKLPKLNPARFGKLPPNCAAIVKSDFGVFMQPPGKLNQELVKRLKRTMSLMRGKINRSLAPIGGEVVTITPGWQKGIALLHVIFKINGVDPTRGSGCYIYKNCEDFYYGPWCQRTGHHNGEIDQNQLNNNPPRYTLRGWIVGPLLETAHSERLGTNGPKKFSPSNTTLLLKGTQIARDKDEKNTSDSIQYELAKLIAARVKDLDYEEKQAFRHVVSRHLALQESQHAQPLFKLPVQRRNTYANVPIIFIETADFKNWEYRVTVAKSNTERHNNPEIVYPHNFGFEIEFDQRRWGAPDELVVATPDFTENISHYQWPRQGCSCDGCTYIRTAVYQSLVKGKAMRDEELQEIRRLWL